jgi:DNA-binding CsgD family transcriptional regulator
VPKYYEKYTNVQYEDVEEAFKDAVKAAIKKKPASEGSVKKAIAKEMEKTLSAVNRKKKGIGRSLSCVKAIKAAVSDKDGNKPISDLMKRASRILTNQEIKVLRMCSDGKSVRSIGSELGISYPTAWRTLNSAIDKIRMSHGMRSRHLDRR